MVGWSIFAPPTLSGAIAAPSRVVKKEHTKQNDDDHRKNDG